MKFVEELADTLMADGVALSIGPGGELKVRGGRKAIERHIATIREHKPALLALQHHNLVRDHYQRCLEEGFTPRDAAETAVVELLLATQPASQPDDPCYHCGKQAEPILEYGVQPTFTRLHPACHQPYMNQRMRWAASVLDEAIPPGERQPQKKGSDNG